MNKFVQIIIITILLLSACNSPKPIITELSSTTSTYDETIRINNCGNKAESTQAASRSFSLKISGTGIIKAGYEKIIEGSVSATYEQYKNITKTQTLIAAANTNMEFILRWSDNIRAGNATINRDVADYTVNIPVSVEQISSQDLGCDDTPNPMLTATSTSTPVPLPTATEKSISIAGNWKGITTGTNSGNPMSERAATLTIPTDCQLGEECGFFSTEGACIYQMTLIDIQNNVFEFEAITISGADFCYSGDANKDNVKITLVINNEIFFHYETQGSVVIQEGTLIKE